MRRRLRRLQAFLWGGLGCFRTLRHIHRLPEREPDRVRHAELP